MNIVITGAAEGLGAFLVERFSKTRNCNVVGIDIKKFNEIDILLKPLFYKYFEYDLNKLEGIPTLIKEIISEISDIDLLINNAGLKTFGTLENLSIETIISTFQVNSLAPIIIARSLINRMNSSGMSIIINISSNAGFKGYKYGSIYCASKAALNIFTEAISDEGRLGPDIKIYTICPSTIFTKEIAQKYPDANPNNYIQPEEIFQEIQKIIRTGSKLRIIPILSYKQILKYSIDGFRNHLTWLLKK
ncbi:MAG: SDR family oxidoreductase [Bacteroidales bacterium]